MFRNSIFSSSLILAAVAAMAAANVIEPIQPALINPADPLFPHSYGKQAEIQSIQNDIDSIVAEVQRGFLEETRVSSANLLNQFETFANTINAKHAPVLTAFNQLPAGSCRDGAETLINTTRTQTGFNAGNCATRVNTAVANIIAKIDRLFENFNRQFSEIQQIVIKSYIKSNLFVDMPDVVIDKMDSFFNNVDARWKEQKPEFSKLRAQLAADLAVEHAKLTSCNAEVVVFADTMFGLTAGQISSCEEFNQAQRAGARAAAPRNYMEEAMNFMNSYTFTFAQEE